ARAPPTRWRYRWWRRWSSAPWAASSPRRRPARRRSAAARSSSRPSSSSEIERHPVAGALQCELAQVGEPLAAQVREDEPPAAQVARARGDRRVREGDADRGLVGAALAQEEVLNEEEGQAPEVIAVEVREEDEVHRARVAAAPLERLQDGRAAVAEEGVARGLDPVSAVQSATRSEGVAGSEYRHAHHVSRLSATAQA